MAEDDRVLARLLHEHPDASIVIDADGRVKWANRAAERLFGRSLLESVGMSGLELVHPADLEFALLSLTSVHAKETGSPIEVRVTTRSGWRLVELIGSPVPWLEDGSVLLCLRDLTDRRRFEIAHHRDDRLRSLVQNSAAISMLVSPDGVVESASGALTRLLGHDPEMVEGRPLSELVSEADRPVLEAALECSSSARSTTDPVRVRLSLVRKGKTEPVPFELAVVNLLDDPTVGGYVVSSHDISGQVRAEHELRQTLSLLTATLDSTADGIVVVDGTGRIVSFNRRFAEMWRLPESWPRVRDEVGEAAFLRDRLELPDGFVAKLNDLDLDPEAESCDVLRFVDGRVLECFSMPQWVDGEVVGRVWSFRDVTDRNLLEERLAHQAFHDSLTGLANRALFQERLQHAVARAGRTHGRLAVLFLDLDNLKMVNDSLGHSAGDALLQATAEILLGCVRESDTAARLGGDEFGVLLEEIADRVGVIKLVERMLTAVRRPLAFGGQVVSASVSVGMTFYEPGISSDQLLSNADRAMYAAKERGGNRYTVFKDGMGARIERVR
jgi:diguanylate cyclase (GGDEF)-like protein/PAS domain S-box-containing protein